MLRLAVLGSTRGTTLQAIIDAIQAKKLAAEILLVISNKEDAYILTRAKEHGIESRFIDPKNKTREEFDADVMTILEEKKVDLVLLIGYMRFISPLFVRRWRNKVLNVHPSLLPAFAGGMDLDVHERVIASGAKETGCTVHFVDEGADTGPIIIQKKCFVEKKDTSETLKKKVQDLEGEAFVEAIQQVISQKS